MKLWMDVMRDLESVMNDHERILDAWAEGGVDGVVFGPLVFGTSKLSKNALAAPTGDIMAEAYDPNPAVYARLGVEPPPPPEQKLPGKRALLEKTMNAAGDRGMQVYCMYADGGAGPGGQGHHLHDDRTLASRVARMVDTLEHFPMAGRRGDGRAGVGVRNRPPSHGPPLLLLSRPAGIRGADGRGSRVRLRGHGSRQGQAPVPAPQPRPGAHPRARPRRPGRSLPHARSRSRPDGLAVVPGRLADPLFPPHPRGRRRRAGAPGAPRVRPALGRLRSLVRVRLRRPGPVHGFPDAEALLLSARLRRLPRHRLPLFADAPGVEPGDQRGRHPGRRGSALRHRPARAWTTTCSTSRAPSVRSFSSRW